MLQIVKQTLGNFKKHTITRNPRDRGFGTQETEVSNQLRNSFWWFFWERRFTRFSDTLSGGDLQ